MKPLPTLTLVEISKRIEDLEAVVLPLQRELSKLKRRRANMENCRKRKPKSSRDAQIVLAYGFLTNAEPPRSRRIKSMHLACIDLGIQNPPPNLTQKAAIEVLALIVNVTKARIRQILSAAFKK